MSRPAEEALRDILHQAMRGMPDAIGTRERACFLAEAVTRSGWCPTCGGAGEVEVSTTPGVDPRDPAHETDTLPCGDCAPTVQPINVTVRVQMPPGGGDPEALQARVMRAVALALAWPTDEEVAVTPHGRQEETPEGTRTATFAPGLQLRCLACGSRDVYPPGTFRVTGGAGRYMASCTGCGAPGRPDTEHRLETI